MYAQFMSKIVGPGWGLSRVRSKFRPLRPSFGYRVSPSRVRGSPVEHRILYLYPSELYNLSSSQHQSMVFWLVGRFYHRSKGTRRSHRMGQLPLYLNDCANRMYGTHIRRPSVHSSPISLRLLATSSLSRGLLQHGKLPKRRCVVSSMSDFRMPFLTCDPRGTAHSALLRSQSQVQNHLKSTPGRALNNILRRSGFHWKEAFPSPGNNSIPH